jgi:hypothetical protein
MSLKKRPSNIFIEPLGSNVLDTFQQNQLAAMGVAWHEEFTAAQIKEREFIVSLRRDLSKTTDTKIDPNEAILIIVDAFTKLLDRSDLFDFQRGIIHRAVESAVLIDRNLQPNFQTKTKAERREQVFKHLEVAMDIAVANSAHIHDWRLEKSQKSALGNQPTPEAFVNVALFEVKKIRASLEKHAVSYASAMAEIAGSNSPLAEVDIRDHSHSFGIHSLRNMVGLPSLSVSAPDSIRLQ